MTLSVDLYVEEDGVESLYEVAPSQQQVEDGVIINDLLPEKYRQYVPEIYAKLADDGFDVLLTYEGKTHPYSIIEDATWDTGLIYLESGYCTVTINFETDEDIYDDDGRFDAWS